MTDHAKCRVCGGEPYSCCDEEALLPEHWIECGGVTGEFRDVACWIGPRMTSPERAWAAWDELMRPSIPEPLRKLVAALHEAVHEDETTSGFEYMTWYRLVQQFKILPPELLAACLKETDDD